jgi:DNA polymerase epsilon subunit 1
MARGSGTFGLVSSRRGGARGSYRGSNTSFRGRGRGRGRGAGGSGGGDTPAPAPLRDEDGTALEERFERTRVDDEVDEKLGFERIAEGPPREGWLVNMHPVSL